MGACLAKPTTFRIDGTTYVSKKCIGDGGFAYVYEVEGKKKRWALKRMIVSEEDQLEHALREIEFMKRIPAHDNVIEICSSAVRQHPKREDLQEVLILMELCKDGTVLDMMNENTAPLPESKVITIFTQVCIAVAFLHGQDPPIVHRDLKLENILVAADGHYKLCDFGSATTEVVRCNEKRVIMVAEEDIEKHTTLAYRAPEQVDLHDSEVINEKVDIWALGCLLYQLLFRKTPFTGTSNLEILNAKFDIPESSYSSELTNLIGTLLCKDASLRPSAAQLVETVQKLQSPNVEKTPAEPNLESESEQDNDNSSESHSCSADPEADADPEVESSESEKDTNISSESDSCSADPEADVDSELESSKSEKDNDNSSESDSCSADLKADVDSEVESSESEKDNDNSSESDSCSADSEAEVDSELESSESKKDTENSSESHSTHDSG